MADNEHQGDELADVDEDQGAAAERGLVESFTDAAANAAAGVDDDEGPLSEAERARIRALCFCGHPPAAHPSMDARCDVPDCRCRGYRRIGTVHVVAPATWRIQL